MKGVFAVKLTYPAIFEPFEDASGYTVSFPDLPGCVTEGETLADAILMAEDAASGWVLGELEDGRIAPSCSPISGIALVGEQFVNLIAIDTDSYAEKYGMKVVRKNLTIPAWLNTFAEAQHINFSSVLTDALASLYQAKMA